MTQLQKTIGKTISYKGRGLHLGKEVTLTLEPAPPGKGVVFVREDLPGSPQIKARVDKVASNVRGTSLGEGGVKVRTVEHIIAVKSGHSFNVRLIQKLGKMMSRKKGLLNIGDIERILPHRYPFLLVDRILELGDKKIVGIKNFTINEPYFDGHFPGHPVVPAVLIIETMAQVAGVYLLSESENQGKLAYFAGIDKARFRKPVIPGDQLITRVKILNLKKNIGKVHATSFVAGELVAEAEFLFGLVEK